ncbi:hypothetical protein KFK09_003061 [Dendrobium nobile]|uniref:SANTA domain-containing protein n=1 Tax=Dendrobium nobile TaxID=94219 RepID=A0A8T3C822_DENNO|nr:hypothetical protein KFK09_003061 [Dendrobium nobile]
MASKVVAAQRSPESKSENPRIPPVQQKEVLLFEWWLIKAEKAYNGKRLTVGGFTKRGEAVGIFKSAPIIKRHDHCTLETADGITLRIQGSINKTRTIDNGFPLEVCNAFWFGFPSSWDIFFEESSGSNPCDSKMLEHQPETRFDPSFQQKTVFLRNWWLRGAEKGSDGNSLAVGGFTEWGKAMRIFDSSPIIKRHDAYTLETADGITIRIEGFINEKRTLDNGFPFEACKTFLIGFPTTWTDYASDSSRDKSSHAEMPLIASRGAGCCKDSLENVPFGFPVKSKNIIPENVSPTSNTSARASGTRLREAILKFATWVSTSSPVHMPFVDRSSHHLPERSICDNNQLQNDESCGANMSDAHTIYRFQDDETHGTNLRDAHSVYNYCETGHTPVDNASEKREASCTEGLHTEGAGCPSVDLHLDGLPEEKCNGHVVSKGHHDECVGTCSTSNLWDSVAGKGHQKEEIAQEKDEKNDVCSTRRPKKVRSVLSNVENHGEDQKYAKLTSKPVRRSLRLMPSNNLEDVHGEFQDSPQFLKGTNDMNCANLILDRSKTCANQPIDTLVKDGSSSPNHYVEAQKCAKSLAKPVRKSEKLVLLKLENVHGEFQDHSQFLNETNNMNHANLSPDGSKTSARSQPNYTMLKGNPLSPTSNILVPSAGVLSEENQDVHKHSFNTHLGLVEETPANSKAVTSQTMDKKMLRCTGRKKDNQTARSRTKAEKNCSRNQSSGTSFEENILVSSASLSRPKAIPLTPISDKSSTMRKNSEVAKYINASTETQQTKDKASHSIAYKTVWVSSYTDGQRTPLTRSEKKKSSILTPESLNLKRSRSGRLLIPRLDCSMRVMYEPDGSFAGTATVDGSRAGNATVVMSTSQCKGS